MDAARTEDVSLLDAALLPDLAVEADAAPDAAPPDVAPDAEPFPPSDRVDGLRVEGGRLTRDGVTTATPRGIVISGDSLARAARTPLHDREHYEVFRGRGFDLAWLLVSWEGISPRAGIYDGAFMGRICEQAGWAAEVGLDVVLAMLDDAPEALDVAEAWRRLVEACAGVPVAGVAVDDPELERVAEAAFGPLLVFGTDARGPDHVSLGASRPRFAAGPGVDELDAAERDGSGWAVWHDGFATDAGALRDEDGNPTEAWYGAAERTWPVSVAGRVLGFGPRDGGWSLRWEADGANSGLSRVGLGRLGGDVEATLEPDGPFDWFTGYDPVTDELSVFVEGDVGEVELTLMPVE